MRDFTWKYFTMTGDVEAYMLYKDYMNTGREEDPAGEEELVQEEVSELTS
ncbi:YqzL family protein [Paenibacillus gansuensis]|uniref:YqzL family protein n=1 Tax=Paenibacillus gansuensis TaxID=306542 RepID=A0ABW5PE58_9BACL